LCSYLVFEFLECNLYEIMKDRQKYFAESVLRNYMYAKPLPLPSY
jgi:protein kinase